jgi:pimeloyl-ACP methyl ester carboxylesterase
VVRRQQGAQLRGQGALPEVVSSDGTAIAYEIAGSGRPIVLVGGGLTDRAENSPLVPLLARKGFTVCNYDRRGRGASGDSAAYAVEREIEDLRTLIERLAGGEAVDVFGASSGGALALTAAAAGNLPIKRIAVYEVPYLLGDAMLSAWAEYVTDLQVALGDDRRADAVELFMRLAGSSDEGVARARESGTRGNAPPPSRTPSPTTPPCSVTAPCRRTSPR